MKIYILLDGCNSNDSELKGVYSSEENAQIGFEKLKNNPNNSFNWFWIKEWEMDGEYIKDIECNNDKFFK